MKEATVRYMSTRRLDFACAQLRILSYIDVTENKVITSTKNHMFVVWNINNDTQKEYKTRFEEGKVYRIKGRKWIGGNHYIMGEFSDDIECFYVSEVIGEVEDCKELEEIYAEFIRPVVISNETFGELSLNKEFYTLNGTISYHGANIGVRVEVKEGKEKTWQKNIRLLEEFYRTFENTDKLARELVANKLYRLACNYNEDGITKEEIAERIRVSEITMINSKVEIDYEDDGIFGGHGIVVEGSVKSGLKKAYIWG